MRRMSKTARLMLMNNSRDTMESRFRDRRGREHYENGRYAPARSEYTPPYYDGRHLVPPVYEAMDEPRRDWTDDGRRSNWRGQPRDAYEIAWDGSGKFRREYEDGRRMVGFGGPEMHVQGPERMDEMEHRRSQMDRGYSNSEAVPPLTLERAKHWTEKMQNEDGSRGPHWSYDQTTQVMQQRGYKHEPATWYAILNAVYSDYCGVAQKYGMAGNVEFFADIANAWLDDKDAVKDKAAAYYAYIVKS